MGKWIIEQMNEEEILSIILLVHMIDKCNHSFHRYLYIPTQIFLSIAFLIPYFGKILSYHNPFAKREVH